MSKKLKLLDTPLLHVRSEVKQHQKAKTPEKSGYVCYNLLCVSRADLFHSKVSLRKSHHPQLLHFSLGPVDGMMILDSASTVYTFSVVQTEV